MANPDIALVRLYWPVELRPAFDALIALDEVMAEVVATSTQPALGAVRLAWWREALERLDHGSPPAEPRLQAAAEELLSRGIKGAELAALEDGWATLLDEEPEMRRVAKRGQRMFALGARLLGANDPALDALGRLTACVDAARRGHFELAAPGEALQPHRLASALRPLTGLAALARRDIERGGPPYEPPATPGRAWTLLRHRITGRL